MMRIFWKIVWAGLCFLNLSLSLGATSEDTTSGKDAKSFTREGSMESVAQEDLPIPDKDTEFISAPMDNPLHTIDFITEDMDKPLDSIPVLTDISSYKQQSTLEWLHSFSLPNMEVSHYDRIINIIEGIPTPGINDILRRVEIFLKKNKDKLSPESIIKSIAIIKNIPADGEDDVLRWAPFLTEDGSEEEYFCFLQAIRPIPFNDKEDVLGRVDKIIKNNSVFFIKNVDVRALIKIIEAIHKIITPKERDDVLGRVSKFFKDNSEFFTGNAHDHASGQIVRAVSQITPSQERDDVLERAPNFFAKNLDEKEDYAKIIKAIGDIRRKERDDVLARAFSLFKSGMERLERVSIIGAIRKITSSEERDDVLGRAFGFIKDYMNGIQRALIIDAIHSIPHLRRQEILIVVGREIEEAERNGELTNDNRANIINQFINLALNPLHRRNPALHNVAAFQVHNVAKAAGAARREDGREEGITITRARALVKEKMAEQTIVKRQRIETFIESYIDHNKRLSIFTKEQRNALSQALINAINWDDLTLVYSFVTKLHKKQLNVWGAGFIEDSLTAYDGNNSLSCVAGTNERIFLALRELHLEEFSTIFDSANINQERSEFLSLLTLSRPERAPFIAKVLGGNGYKIGQTTPIEAGQIMKRYAQDNLPYIDKDEKEKALQEYEDESILDGIIDSVVEDFQKGERSLILPFIRSTIAKSI